MANGKQVRLTNGLKIEIRRIPAPKRAEILFRFSQADRSK